MNNSQNIELKEQNDPKKSFQNSELFPISNKIKDLNQINNLHNETFNQINVSTSNEIDFKPNDKLFGNNYLNYYLNNKSSSSKNCFNSKIKKMGNLFVYFFINEQPLIVLGENSKILIFVYECILHISFIFFFTILIKTIPLYMKLLLIIIYIICFLCHIYIYLFNPGIPSIDHYSKFFLKSEKYMKMGEEKKREYYLCDICNIIYNYSENIEHCDECEVCVQNYDHHCYWTGKCITKRNIWAFYLFLYGTLAYILWYFTIIIYWIVKHF